MPPKKRQAATKGTNETNKPAGDTSKPKPNSAKEGDKSQSNGASSNVPSKRKAPKAREPPSKAPRRSARGAQPQAVDSTQLIKFLLSPSSLDLCRPKDEIEDIKNRGDQLRTYSSSAFSPFEELVCAVILSRPISHTLGLRSIRTIFNPPYNLTTPRKIREAGYEGVRKALDEARTQHRQKTAEELVMLANAFAEALGDGEEDVFLAKVTKDAGHDLEKEREILKNHVKGLGSTGLDIFVRRVQWLWLAAYPFTDARTRSSLEKLGLPGDAEQLKALMENSWEQLDAEDIEGDMAAKKRKAFVRILERAVGLDLEGNMDSAKSSATADTS
ncbi:MAG: hypothetical protein Q9190_006228 [Brigantiaea leucoxantha]